MAGLSSTSEAPPRYRFAKKSQKIRETVSQTDSLCDEESEGALATGKCA